MVRNKETKIKERRDVRMSKRVNLLRPSEIIQIYRTDNLRREAFYSTYRAAGYEDARAKRIAEVLTKAARVDKKIGRYTTLYHEINPAGADVYTFLKQLVEFFDVKMYMTTEQALDMAVAVVALEWRPCLEENELEDAYMRLANELGL